MNEQKKITVVVPAYNEEDVIDECYRRVIDVFSNLDYKLELIFVNDGSCDNTFSLLNELSSKDENVVVIDLSRNFGKEIAMSAGIDFATGDAAVIIDADLQDPPELIVDFVKYWEQGYDNIYGKRIKRDGESWFKKATANMFYKVLGNLSDTQIPVNTGDFRLISRQAIDALKELREQHRFMKGLFSWVGFNTKEVEYNRAPRFAGDTKWNYWRLWNFALEGITSFSIAPLKIATYVGGFISSLSFVYAIYIVVKTFIYGADVAGYPSQMVITLLLGGMNLAAIGIIGEYLGRMFNETKNRPLYLVKKVINRKKAV